MAKSICMTYFLWLFGGISGLHHFYLRRDRHAFVWFATLGGVFGLGWLREITRIPTYVREANQTKEYVEERTLLMEKRKKPHLNSTRLAGELIVGTLFGYLVSLAIPSEEEHEVVNRWAKLLVPFAIATGVHLVGNIGMERGNLKWPVLGSYFAFGAFSLAENPNAIAYAAISATFFFNWKSKDFVRQAKPKRSFIVRTSVLTTCGIIYLGLFGSFLYFNAKYKSPDGQFYTFREGVDNFLHSKAWTNFKSTMGQLWEYKNHHGWSKIFEEILTSVDPYGESRAYAVLELTSDATQKEITERYRKLTREWHPDKHRDPEKKIIAEKRFIEVAQAYEKISQMRAARTKASRRAQSHSGSHTEL